MKYLMYYWDGFVKKFPLRKVEITLGRGEDNDLIINDDFVSTHHLEIEVQEDSVTIQDLDSTNGTYVQGGKIKEVVIRLGESFSVGSTEFFLREGTLDEFEPGKELVPIFEHLGKDNKRKAKHTRTRYVQNIYRELLKQILQNGLKKKNLQDFIMDLSNYLSNLTDLGSLFIVSKKNGRIQVRLSIKRQPHSGELFDMIIGEVKKLYKKNLIFQPIASKGERFYSYPLDLEGAESALIYIPNDTTKRENVKIEKFLLTLAKEISLLSHIIAESRDNREIRNEVEKGADDIDIIAISPGMEKLVKQAKKIAGSDLFVLIHGESGTGKELFARLIHNNSWRRKGVFVALNCASIPENLLESELFGYEKGAFTGAYSQNKGKLELASGGTLVLDEIGDMPLSLQARLLRAIQENEFYRLGGHRPIKVDLRIISLTNKNLKQLVKEGRFRNDLYFRLVHRSLYILPLRKHKEDISVLINYFTRKFCRICEKNIQGYSVKALEALESYEWPGNVRELENEIKSVVNLTDDGELITYDIISNEIKGIRGDYDFEDEEEDHGESEVDQLLHLLKKNRWNKSRTARELDMTYRGLHKKMQRLGIQRPANRG
jgi:Nif-specific regulatory protein